MLISITRLICFNLIFFAFIVIFPKRNYAKDKTGKAIKNYSFVFSSNDTLPNTISQKKPADSTNNTKRDSIYKNIKSVLETQLPGSKDLRPGIY